MEHLLDKLLILSGCLVLGYAHAESIPVVAFLCALTMTCLNDYFHRNWLLTLTLGSYCILCVLEPVFLCFLPLVLYDSVYMARIRTLFLLLILLFSDPEVLLSREAAYVLILSLLSLSLANKSLRIQKKNLKLTQLTDDSTELKLLSEQRQRDLILQHDSDLHIATLSERNRIAREIHDNVGHMLSRSLLQVGALIALNQDDTFHEHLLLLKNTLDMAMNNIRESVHDLKDESVELRSMVDSTLKDYPGYKIQLDYDMSEHLSRDLKYCFIAILKEALSNTAKHSNADSIHIVFCEHPALYQLLIEDNGTDPVTPSSTSLSRGIGLENMQERVNAFHGNLTLTRKNGFRIFISIPKNERSTTYEHTDHR